MAARGGKVKEEKEEKEGAKAIKRPICAANDSASISTRAQSRPIHAHYPPGLQETRSLSENYCIMRPPLPLLLLLLLPPPTREPVPTLCSCSTRLVHDYERVERLSHRLHAIVGVPADAPWKRHLSDNAKVKCRQPHAAQTLGRRARVVWQQISRSLSARIEPISRARLLRDVTGLRDRVAALFRRRADNHLSLLASSLSLSLSTLSTVAGEFLLRSHPFVFAPLATAITLPTPAVGRGLEALDARACPYSAWHDPHLLFSPRARLSTTSGRRSESTPQI